MSLWGSAVTDKIANTVCWQWWLQYDDVADIFFFLHCPFYQDWWWDFSNNCKVYQRFIEIWTYYIMNSAFAREKLCEKRLILWKHRVHQLYSIFCSLFYLSNACLKNLPVWYAVAVRFHFHHFHRKLTDVPDAVDKIVCRETMLAGYGNIIVCRSEFRSEAVILKLKVQVRKDSALRAWDTQRCTNKKTQ